MAWHRFTDGDPLIMRAEATGILDVVRDRVGKTVYYSGYAELDGERHPFESEPVGFSGDDPTDLSTVELWAVFDPENLDAGFVVVSARSDAESILEYPTIPLLPFGLVIAGCCWAVQYLRLRPWKFPERLLRPIDQVPVGLWVLFSVPCVLWSIGIAWMAIRASADVPFQPATGTTSESAGPILVWLLLLLPGVGYFAAFFHSTAVNRTSPVRR